MHGICGPFVFETAEFHRTTRNRSRIKRQYCHKGTGEIYSAICVRFGQIFLAETLVAMLNILVNSYLRLFTKFDIITFGTESHSKYRQY